MFSLFLQKISSLLGLTALSGFICLITACALILLLPVYMIISKRSTYNDLHFYKNPHCFFLCLD